MMLVCSLDKGVHGGNMAAVDPSESPKRQKTPAEEVETSGERTGAVGSGCGSSREDETTPNKTTEGPDGVERAAVGRDGGCIASHSEVGVESGAGADKTTCSAPDDPVSLGKMTEAPSGEQRAFDWSETEDDDVERAKTHKREKDEFELNTAKESAEEVQQDMHVDASVTCDAEEIHGEKTSEVRSTTKAPARDRVEDVAEEEEADREQGADSTVKPKQCRLVCKECGKRFTRRETYNLHRHFHAHADELTPLTCKECGLTFQHRSSLIKHRNEHKEKEEPHVLTPKREVRMLDEDEEDLDEEEEEETEDEDGEEEGKGCFECAECERTFSTVAKLRDHNCCNTEKPYHCPLCRQEFQFKVSVTKHMMTHSQESIFTCQECSQSFPNTMALRYHQRCHTALKPYECPECGMVFKHYSVMEDHRRRHTDSTRSHLCNICGKAFKYGSLLHQHQYLHTGQKPFRCPECGKKFAFAQNMKAHCRQHRLRESNAAAAAADATAEQPGKPAPVPPQDAVRGQGKENVVQSEESKRTFNCPLCPQSFWAPANLRAHMLVHEAEYETLERTPRPPSEISKGHNCPHCPCVLRDESSLNVHLSTVHKSVAQYLEKVAVAVAVAPPNKQFAPLNSENAPGKWRSDGANFKSYKCSECGKSFRHRSVLELHMRIHSKDKPYQCKVCGKGFRFSSYLQQHLIIHTGKKPYKCPDCGKDFAFLQNMKTHQKLHQEKPFRCTSCRKGYSDEIQLQHHMLSHNGEKPHKCERCGKSFGLAYLLRDHMNTHTGERPHRCDECHKTFSWFSSLLVHQKIHARKRQGFSQYGSFPAGARVRGRGSRGRRGGRLAWGLSRPLGGSGMVGSQAPLPYPELNRRAALQQSSVLASRVDLQGRQQKEPWLTELHPQPVQWKVDGGEVMPVPSPQQQHQHHLRGQGWPDGLSASALNSEQLRQHKPVAWSGAATSASTSSDFTVPSYVDGAALWSVRPALLANSRASPNKLGQELQSARAWDANNPQGTTSTVSQAEKPWNGGEPQKQWASGLPGAQIDQSSAMPISTPVSHGVGSAVRDKQATQGTPKTANSPEKSANNNDFPLQQKQVSSGWAAAQTSLGQGMGTAVWGFQSNAAGPPQTLLAGQLKPGNGQELQQQQQQQQQQPMVTGAQIIINQPSPFFSPPLAPLPPLALPGPHPLHSVPVGALSRPPHPNIFFAPQAVMSERPHMPQTLPLPQLTPRTEPHKLGPRLPFAPERLLQCMICGCSFPRELDLQMHYLQHAQGEI